MKDEPDDSMDLLKFAHVFISLLPHTEEQLIYLTIGLMELYRVNKSPLLQ